MLQLLVVCGIGICYVWVSGQDWPEAEGPAIRQQPTLADFELPRIGDAHSGTITLSSLRGKPVVLSFWASWCKVCRQNTGAVLELERRAEAAGMKLYHIASYDDRQSVLQSEAFQQFKAPTLLDTDGVVAQKNRVLGLPALIVIDAEGHLVRKIEGSIGEAEIDAVVRLRGGDS